MEAPRRNTDTSAATRARRMRKWRRWALEMEQEGGWFMAPPDEIALIEAEGWGPGLIAEWYARKVDALERSELNRGDEKR